MDIKKINFKQPKYLLPAIIYLPLLFVGYFIIDMFNVEVSDTTNKKLKTTDYLSSELPEAYTDSILGDKMTNTENQFEGAVYGIRQRTAHLHPDRHPADGAGAVFAHRFFR